MSDADVLIVGAGPAGSSTAWHLASAGARVLVLDRARFPRDKPCAEYLSPEASRILSAGGGTKLQPHVVFVKDARWTARPRHFMR